MDNVLTLIGNPVQAALPSADAEAATAAVKSTGRSVGATDWLAQGIACDLPFDGPLDVIDNVREMIFDRPLDIVSQPTLGRRKKLLVADMESTIIENEMLDELAATYGIDEAIADITARAMAGELEFDAAIKKRVAMLKGLSESALKDALTTIRITPGAAALVATMRTKKAYCALVSGGFEFFTGWVRRRLGFNYDQANRLEIADGKLIGTVKEPILGRDAKREALMRLSAEQGINADGAITVGDGANDLAMLEAAGMGVAFHAKPIVAERARVRIEHGDLTALLYIQGYRQEELVEGL